MSPTRVLLGRRARKQGHKMAWSEVESRPELTHREQQVLELVASGWSAKQIASQIGIAPRTVEGHIETVRLKMRARNKTHLVAQAVQAGILKLRESA
jgi:DNA-binding NarL/FixJ family response regulator